MLPPTVVHEVDGEARGTRRRMSSRARRAREPTELALVEIGTGRSDVRRDAWRRGTESLWRITSPSWMSRRGLDHALAIFGIGTCTSASVRLGELVAVRLDDPAPRSSDSRMIDEYAHRRHDDTPWRCEEGGAIKRIRIGVEGRRLDGRALQSMTSFQNRSI